MEKSRPRKSYLQIRVTDAEAELAKAVAARLGMENLSTYIRKRIKDDAKRLQVAA